MVNVIDVTSTPIKTQYVLSNDERTKHIEYAINHVAGRVQPGENTDEKIAVVCFGPSLKDTWHMIKDYKYVLTCSGAHKYLIDRGIVPTWHVDVDPREHKAGMLGNPHQDVEYLLASVVHPSYIDKMRGFNVKLWHVLNDANLTDVPAHFPRGEWVFGGGCSVGLRALVLTRFLGFRNIDIFGMDCSFPKGQQGEHADVHLNPCKEANIMTTNYGGVVYNTTVAMVEYARDFFRQRKVLCDTNIVLHGEGLLQHMVYNDWQDPNLQDVNESAIAVQVPHVISDDYVKLNQQLHENNPYYGASGQYRVKEVKELAQKLDTQDILDYGCGKGTLGKGLPFPIKEYDPAIPGKNKAPLPADLVVCTDVLEHIEPDYLHSVLGDIARCTKKMAYLVIHTGPAKKTLPDGRNTHLIQEGKAWWWKRLNDHFAIEEMIENGHEIIAWVIPKEGLTKLKEKSEIHLMYTENDKVKFVNVGEKSKWRANTLLTKEPVTIEWLKTLEESDIFVDIGANVGAYSLWSAIHRKVRVYAFEPESQNFALLCQNIYLNNLQDRIVPLCLSVSDVNKLGILSVTELDPGSSCHQFDSTKNFKGEETLLPLKQGSFAVSLDYLVDNNMLPQPTHIKIDVDGNEPRIIQGALRTLMKVRSLLIEVNPSLVEHQRMINFLFLLGFKYDQTQVEKSMRQEGAFKGVAEYVFRRD